MSAVRGTPDGGHGQPRWGPAAEAVAMFALILADIWWVESRVRRAGFALLILVIASHAWRGESFSTLGFRRANLRPCLVAVAPLIVASIALVFALGLTFGTVRPFSAQRLATFVVYYCVWGLFQQYALNGYFVNRFAAAASGSRLRLVPLAAAGCFALVHAPNWFLVAVTFGAGLLGARYYLRFRNLYPLGLAHGLLGTALFFAVPDTVSLHFAIGPRALRWQREQRPVADVRPACPAAADARSRVGSEARDRPRLVGCATVFRTAPPRADRHARRP